MVGYIGKLVEIMSSYVGQHWCGSCQQFVDVYWDCENGAECGFCGRHLDISEDELFI